MNGAVALAEEDPKWLTEDAWRWVSDHLPIACVDVLPVRRDGQGVVSQVGLIRRTFEDRQVWCHVGGRVLYGESTREGAERHLRSTLSFEGSAVPDAAPFFVNEFFRDQRPGFGHDPRKHAVAVCYLADVPAHPTVADGGEALQFRWFDVGATPTDADLWPGTGPMLQAIPQTRHRGRAEQGRQELSYEALSARAISHNELMWQTPLLAMTAMAFLMTIALGDGEAWARATAALLSTVTALVSVQLMAKHSHSQLQDADRLSELEDQLGLVPVHRRPDRSEGWIARRLKQMEDWLVRWRSRHWWLVAMLLFGVVSLVICVLAVLGI